MCEWSINIKFLEHLLVYWHLISAKHFQTTNPDSISTALSDKITIKVTERQRLCWELCYTYINDDHPRRKLEAQQWLSPCVHVYWDKDTGPTNCPSQAETVAWLNRWNSLKTLALTLAVVYTSSTKVLMSLHALEIIYSNPYQVNLSRYVTNSKTQLLSSSSTTNVKLQHRVYIEKVVIHCLWYNVFFSFWRAPHFSFESGFEWGSKVWLNLPDVFFPKQNSWFL